MNKSQRRCKEKYKKNKSWKYHRGNRTAQSKRYRDRYKFKNMAHQAVYRAVKCGKLVKPKSCEKCGKKRYIQAHHEDYEKVLEVLWLCCICHNKIHKERGDENV